jgi:hypothetical protein
VKAALVITLLALTGCDALVGGECLPGFAAADGACVAMVDAEDGGDDGGDGGAGGNGEAGHPIGSGGSDAGGGGPIDPPLVCAEPLTQCGDDCVDTTSDFSNCGGCGVHCPTEICVDSVCVGDPVGHVIVVGMSYADSTPSSERLLGNAVFRPLHSSLRILQWKEHGTISAPVEAIIASEASARSRAYQLETVGAGALALALGAGSWDVLVLHDQPLYDAPTLAAIGATLAEPLGQFTEAGGTVVALATHAGHGAMCHLLGAAELFSCSGLVPVNGAVDGAAPNDVVGNGVLTPFAAKPITSALVRVPAPAPSLEWVFTADGAPVVVHALRGPGAP